MASPETDLIITIGIIILVGFAFAFFVSFAVAMFFYFKGKQRKDSLEVVFKEQLELCKVNYNDNLRALWLIPVVPMFGITEKIEAFQKAVGDKAAEINKIMVEGVKTEPNGAQVLMKMSLGDSIKIQIDSLRTEITGLTTVIQKVVDNYRTGAAIYKGHIIGSNVLDKQAVLEELYEKTPVDGIITLKDNATEGVVQTFSKEEVKALEKAIELNGRHLNLIAYERDTGGGFFGFFKKTSQFIVTAYDNQLLLPGMSREIELKAAAGDVSLLAPGTTRYGKFEFLTGYPQNTQLQAVELKCIVWTMVNRQIIGNISGAVQDAFDMNVGFSQGQTYKELERPIQAQKPERGGG